MQKVMEQWTNIQILDFEWTSGDYPNISLLNLHMIRMIWKEHFQWIQC